MIALLIVLAMGPLCWSQTVTIVRTGVIDAFPDGQKAYSQALSFNKSTLCLWLNTGLTLYAGINGNRSFELDCKPAPEISTTTLKLFPNPAVHYARLQSEGTPLPSGNLELSIIDESGRLMQRRSVDAASLSAGISLYMGMLAAGTYFLKIEGQELRRVIPFIKVN